MTGGIGHIGDGNLHLTVICRGYEDKDLQQRLYDIVDPFVMKFVRDANGSISAEHGIGLQKAKLLSYSKSDEMVMHGFKIGQ